VLLAVTVVVIAVLVSAAVASAATVSVIETIGNQNYAKLSFEAAPAEANDLTVTVASESPDHYGLKLLDNGAAVNPGVGCSGGGIPGVAVLCSIHKPNPSQYENCTKAGCTYVPGSFWETTMSFTLGNGGSRLDASTLPEPPEVNFTKGPPLSITVQPGSGNDTVLTAGGNDRVEPSPGNDTIRTGAGADEFFGGPAPDGADDVDLGSGRNTADYRQRTSTVEFHDDSLANDGAPGEGDRIVNATVFWGGSGDDVIEGSTSPVPPVAGSKVFLGGPGNDLIIGGEGNDLLRGQEGDDRIYGRGGNDEIEERPWETASGDDFADGGPGNDEIALANGDDRAEGGAGNDEIELGPGNDSGEGGADGDLISGGEGSDHLAGGEGDDRLLGERGHDTLEGDAGNDRIIAGTVVQEAWGRHFLNSPGPIENEADRVDCGAGTGDKATVDKTDSTVSCEVAQRVRMLEILGLFQAHDGFEAQLQYVVRRPGFITLTSSGLIPRREKNEDKYYGSTARLFLHPTGRTKRKLNQTGHARVPIKVTFRWGRHKTVVKKKIRLVSPHPIPA
jgi:Ca2+-binding RTX toxin-like protein